jgi:uncharacterized protein (DUF2384 family)
MKEIKLQDYIIDSLELGMNIKLLLLATGIDEETFMHKVEYDKFTRDESIKIHKLIKSWRKANAIF